MKKGIDGTFVQYGIKKEDMQLLEHTLVKIVHTTIGTASSIIQMDMTLGGALIRFLNLIRVLKNV